MQKTGDAVQRKQFLMRGLIKGVEKMSILKRKNGHISKTVRDTTKITVNH